MKKAEAEWNEALRLRPDDKSFQLQTRNASTASERNGTAGCRRGNVNSFGVPTSSSEAPLPAH